VLPLGYPVPVPVASLEPVDGFREYGSLMARLHGLAMESSDLQAEAVGTTHAGRSIWAFVVSSATDLDQEGLPKPAFYLNGTTHAREWGIPEVATATIEHLIEGAARHGLERFLLDNTRLVIVPVQNVDGLLQTQRYPASAILDTDPRFPAHWPRDGRMRRKNMRGVDEDLYTFADHLGGIDLNRNHPPFWATSSQSSPNPADLVYHGVGPQSEPEVQAMLQALALAPESRLRLGIDLHSYTQVFFASNTGNPDLLSTQNLLLQRLAQHHQQVSRSERFPLGRLYRNLADPPNLGIGTHAEYFAYSFGVPSWTLEIEPGDAAGLEYGGTGVSHSGFVLPDSEVRRVADAWAQSHQVAFYFMAGPPHLAALEIDALPGGVAQPRYRAQRQLQAGERVERVLLRQDLVPGQVHRARLRFSKPMRVETEQGLQGLPGLPLSAPSFALQKGGLRLPVSISNSRWLRRGEGAWRYDGDTMEFDFVPQADAAPGDYLFTVEAQDLVGLRLDPDPRTPVDWAQGRWQGYEGPGGGEDRGFAVRLGTADIELLAYSGSVVEGDSILAQVRRQGSLQSPLWAALCEPAAAPVTLADCLAGGTHWSADEQAVVTLRLPVADDLQVQGDRELQVAVLVWNDPEQVRVAAELGVTVLDNDRSGHRSLRLAQGQSLDGAMEGAAAFFESASEAVNLVLDGNGRYALGEQGVALDAAVAGRLRIHANGAELVPGQARLEQGGDLWQVLPGGDLELRNAWIGLGDAGQGTSLQSVFRNAGRLQLRGGGVAGLQAASLLDNSGEAEITGSWFDALQLSEALLSNRGEAVLRASSLTHSSGALARGPAGLARLEGVTAFQLDSHGPLLQGAVDIGGSWLSHYRVLDASGKASGIPACAEGVNSLGYNRVGTDCAFFGPGDQRIAVEPPGLELDRPRGTVAPPVDARDLVPAAHCAVVDQLGSPRPQSAGTLTDCDIGAMEVGVAPFRGFWIPDRPGHGVDVQTAGNRMFIAWYTYDNQGEPTMYSAVAPFTGPLWQTELLSSRRDPASGAIERYVVGEVTIQFQSDSQARLRWHFFEGDLQGEEGIRAYLFDSRAPRVEITGTWYPPAESGWGASIARQGEHTGVVVYYYDALGTLRWALGIGDAGDVVELPLLHHTGFCPNCSSAEHPVQTVLAGTARVLMLDPGRVEVSTDLAYPGAAGGSWRRAGAEFVPLNSPVDNRRLRHELGGQPR